MLYSKILPRFHKRWVLAKRVQVIAGHMANLLPESGSVLDVGCGDGQICRLILQQRSTLQFMGVEVVERPQCAIPMQMYDGVILPFEDKSVDFVTFVDVLHHTDSPQQALAEAVRVARYGIVIKDHICETPFDRMILSFMDKVGNVSHGVLLPGNYLSRSQWKRIFSAHGLETEVWNEQLGLYPYLVRSLFENGLHFICRLLFI